MKRTMLVSTAALGIAILPLGAAQAQDPFEGGFIGFHAGLFTGSVNAEAETYYFGGPIDGFVGGVLAGYNFPHQAGSNVMFGLEGDFGWANISGDGTILMMDACVDVCDEIYPYDVTWDAHLWGRALFGQGNARPFIKAGLALGNLQIEDYRGTFAGVSVGGGIDAMLSPHLVGRIEAFYDWYCDKDVEYELNEWGTVDWSGLTARVALIYKFNP